MAINRRCSDAQECHVWVNAARSRFLERVFDCLYGTLYEAVRLRVVGRGRHIVGDNTNWQSAVRSAKTRFRDKRN